MKESQMVERRVTYTLEHEGRLYVVENVPARVDEETGEQIRPIDRRTAAGGDPK